MPPAHPPAPPGHSYPPAKRLRARSHPRQVPLRMDRGDHPHVALHPQQWHYRGLPQKDEINPASSVRVPFVRKLQTPRHRPMRMIFTSPKSMSAGASRRRSAASIDQTVALVALPRGHRPIFLKRASAKRLALPCNITFLPTTPPSPNFGLDPASGSPGLGFCRCVLRVHLLQTRTQREHGAVLLPNGS